MSNHDYVRTTHRSGETRLWMLNDAVTVVDFSAAAAAHCSSPVMRVDFLREHELPCAIIEMRPVKES